MNNLKWSILIVAVSILDYLSLCTHLNSWVERYAHFIFYCIFPKAFQNGSPNFYRGGNTLVGQEVKERPQLLAFWWGHHGEENVKTSMHLNTPVFDSTNRQLAEPMEKGPGTGSAKSPGGVNRLDRTRVGKPPSNPRRLENTMLLRHQESLPFYKLLPVDTDSLCKSHQIFVLTRCN